MTTREAVHYLVDGLPEDQTNLALLVLEDLQGASDSGGAPLDAESLASLDRGLADIAARQSQTSQRIPSPTPFVSCSFFVSREVLSPARFCLPRGFVSREAEKTLDRLDRSTERRIRAGFHQLATDPFDPRLSAPLVERAGVRKSRVGGWRILFTGGPGRESCGHRRAGRQRSGLQAFVNSGRPTPLNSFTRTGGSLAAITVPCRFGQTTHSC